MVGGFAVEHINLLEDIMVILILGHDIGRKRRVLGHLKLAELCLLGLLANLNLVQVMQPCMWMHYDGSVKLLSYRQLLRRGALGNLGLRSAVHG